MKLISIRNPWAWFLYTGLKQYETRGWKTPYRGPLAIHVTRNRMDGDSMAVLEKARARCGERFPAKKLHLLDEMRGKIVAVGILADCIPMHSINPSATEAMLGDFSPGRYALVIERLQRLPEFVEIPRGAQGYPVAVHDEVRNRILRLIDDRLPPSMRDIFHERHDGKLGDFEKLSSRDKPPVTHETASKRK